MKGGQRVDILIIAPFTRIPVLAMSPEDIAEFKGPLADLLEGVAGNAEFLARVQEFVSTSVIPEEPDPTPPHGYFNS